MLAAVFAGEGRLELQERPRPRAERGTDVVIEVEGCGICGTDLHILETPPRHPATPGVILGHEFIGRVVEAGTDVRRRKVGERVAVAPNITCGLCASCRAGRPNRCDQFVTLGVFRDGGFARWAAAPESACYSIAPAVAFENAIFTELLSCVVNSVDLTRPRPGELAVVIGGGPVGALHALLFQAAGARVVVSDVSAHRLGVLARAGIKDLVNARQRPLDDAVRERSSRGADIVVDAVGNQFSAAIAIAADGGRISLFGMDSEARSAISQNLITRNELTIYGAYIGVNTFPRAISILERAVIVPAALISNVQPLDQIHDALNSLRTGSAMKVVIRHTC